MKQLVLISLLVLGGFAMSQNEQQVIEIVVFKLQPGTSDESFLQAANALMPELTAMPGFIKRELGKDQDGTEQWVDIVYWETLEQAQQAAQQMMQLPSAAPFMGMINVKSMTMMHVVSSLR
jgi:quinol monooxygenase YgiN